MDVSTTLLVPHVSLGFFEVLQRSVDLLSISTYLRPPFIQFTQIFGASGITHPSGACPISTPDIHCNEIAIILSAHCIDRSPAHQITASIASATSLGHSYNPVPSYSDLPSLLGTLKHLCQGLLLAVQGQVQSFAFYKDSFLAQSRHHLVSQKKVKVSLSLLAFATHERDSQRSSRLSWSLFVRTLFLISNTTNTIVPDLEPHILKNSQTSPSPLGAATLHP